MAKTKTNQLDERHKLAQRIKQARESSHISQRELGQGIGVSDKSISSYEKARSMPPVEKLKKIAQITNKPLLFFTDESTVKLDIVSKINVVEKELSEIRQLLTKLQKDKKI
jgi:transcriptional regulator with XRE-family HTH domain